MTEKELIDALLVRVDEMYNMLCEEDFRTNKLSFEMGEVFAVATLLKEEKKVSKKK